MHTSAKFRVINFCKQFSIFSSLILKSKNFITMSQLAKFQIYCSNSSYLTRYSCNIAKNFISWGAKNNIAEPLSPTLAVRPARCK